MQKTKTKTLRVVRDGGFGWICGALWDLWDGGFGWMWIWWVLMDVDLVGFDGWKRTKSRESGM